MLIMEKRHAGLQHTGLTIMAGMVDLLIFDSIDLEHGWEVWLLS